MFKIAVRMVLAALVAAAALFAGSVSTVSADHEGDAAPVRRGKWIEVILSQQRLVAWEDGRMVMSTPVSTGTRKTPTVRGTFRIYRKYAKQRMVGRDYDLPNVPYVMYFTGAYALHGTYWHSNFGQPMSHGCVNLPTGKAAWLYQWAPRGTAVVVH
jgi:lipoprotein-anchoring transpeptidase ErfK/SrfK